MLPEAGALELVFLAMVALVVVGPKDLPVLLRKLGQFTAKMRGLASEFRASFDEMARQSELDELRKEVEALRDTRYGAADPAPAAYAAPAYVAEPSPPMSGPLSGFEPHDPFAPSAARPPESGEPSFASDAHPPSPHTPEDEPELPFNAPPTPAAPRVPAAS